MAFQFNLLVKLSNKLDQKLKTLQRVQIKLTILKRKNLVLGDFIFAWLFPLTLYSVYQYILNGEVFTLVAFYTYAIVLAVFSGLGHYLNVRKYLKL